MARQRFIWPQFWDDPDLGELDDAARLLYIGCFSLADDEGRILGDPAYLKSTIFRYRPTMTIEDVERLRDSLAASCQKFIVYKFRTIAYISFTNWADFQHPRHPSPSRLPPPPKIARNRRKPARLSQKSYGNDYGSGNRNASGAVTVTAPVTAPARVSKILRSKVLNPAGSQSEVLNKQPAREDPDPACLPANKNSAESEIGESEEAITKRLIGFQRQIDEEERRARQGELERLVPTTDEEQT